MKERPILFTPENAKKVFKMMKTQTRRIVKPQPEEVGFRRNCSVSPYCTGTNWPLAYYEKRGSCRNSSAPLKCPYGQIGDRLWIREAFTVANEGRENRDVIYRGDPMFNGMTVFDWRWTPSLHMPRWACRTVVELTEIRVERIQDISEEDAVAEGIQKSLGGMWCGSPHKAHGFPKQYNSAIEAFKDRWKSLNGPGSWHRNDWVWALTFRKVEAP